MRARIAAGLLAVAVLAGCAEDPPARDGGAARAELSLSHQEREIWRPLPVRRGGIPVLLYHGLGAPEAFADPADAVYGITEADFAKQMALLQAAGYEAITLSEFRAFLDGRAHDLPDRPVLLTFDDARRDSLRDADPVLRRLGWSAVMFADVGAVDRGEAAYASWEELARAQRSARWEVQLHAGQGHHNITARDGTAGPFYAYRARRESFAAWRERALADIAWGERRLRQEIPGYRPLAFAPPYGNLGQVSTNDRRIPRTLERVLGERYGVVFVQEPARYVRPGDRLAPRLQITRRMSGGDLRDWLARSLPAH